MDIVYVFSIPLNKDLGYISSYKGHFPSSDLYFTGLATNAAIR